MTRVARSYSAVAIRPMTSSQRAITTSSSRGNLSNTENDKNMSEVGVKTEGSIQQEAAPAMNFDDVTIALGEVRPLSLIFLLFYPSSTLTFPYKVIVKHFYIILFFSSRNLCS